jgi:phenylacetate-coenzyme A ligase PaaK-like adenylate-forming protein
MPTITVPHSNVFTEQWLFGSLPFEEKALALFRFQAAANSVYREYLTLLGRDPTKITALAQIPFLPIGFFKHHAVSSRSGSAATVFESSGTTGQTRSRHHVHDTDWYEMVARRLFEQTYGPLRDWHVLALLPSYLERTGSSLVYMVSHFMQASGSAHGGFFLHNRQQLVERIEKLRETGGKVLLIGVTFALLELAEQFGGRHWPDVTVMETGGMKGRREEMTRDEVHATLKAAFGLPAVHSEYGMTELLSQAYSSGEGVFTMPPTMRVFLRDVNDPFCMDYQLRHGGINVIDLANVDSCAFIETEDLGVLHSPDAFKVLGRLDNADVRGCNLLVTP